MTEWHVPSQELLKESVPIGRMWSLLLILALICLHRCSGMLWRCGTTGQLWLFDGYGAPTSVAHALKCRKGGLVIRRHNEVRDALGEMMAMAFGNQTVKEPVVQEADPASSEEGLVADLAVRGL